MSEVVVSRTSETVLENARIGIERLRNYVNTFDMMERRERYGNNPGGTNSHWTTNSVVRRLKGEMCNNRTRGVMCAVFSHPHLRGRPLGGLFLLGSKNIPFVVLNTGGNYVVKRLSNKLINFAVFSRNGQLSQVVDDRVGVAVEGTSGGSNFREALARAIIEEPVDFFI